MTDQLGKRRTLDRREQDGEPPSLLVPVLTAGRMLGIGRTKVDELVGQGELELVPIDQRRSQRTEVRDVRGMETGRH